MFYSNIQNEPLSSLFQFNDENKYSQFSNEEENELISDNISTSKDNPYNLSQLNMPSFMSNKYTEEDISLEIFNENNLREEITEKDKMKMYYNSIIKKNFTVKKPKQLINHLKRGRKKQKINENEKYHDKRAEDNLLRKIQVHFLTFIISFMNELFEIFKIKQKLGNLNYEFKSNVNKTHIKYLQNTNIREIICHEINKKYKERIDNASICDKIDNEVIKKIFSENYLKLFRKVYNNKSNIINLKEYGLDEDIILSDKVKLFKDLSNSNKDLENNLLQCAKKNFFKIFNIKKK